MIDEHIVSDWQVTIPPVVEPLSLSDAKLHLKLDADLTEDDSDIERMIRTARERIEEHWGRALITQTLTYVMERFPCGEYGQRDPYGEYRVIKLPQPPLQSVTSVKYIGRADALDTNLDTAYDGATRLHTLNSTLYRVVGKGSMYPARLVPIASSYWPFTELSLLSSALESVQIELIVGFGDTADTLPAKVDRAMKLAIGHYYENRQEVVVGSHAVAIELPQGFYDLLDTDRVFHFA